MALKRVYLTSSCLYLLASSKVLVEFPIFKLLSYRKNQRLPMPRFSRGLLETVCHLYTLRHKVVCIIFKTIFLVKSIKYGAKKRISNLKLPLFIICNFQAADL